MKLSRDLFFITAWALFLLGILHIIAYFMQLTTEQFSVPLQKITDIKLYGQDKDMWKLWKGFSFMMGFEFIIMGLLGITFLRSRPGYPPVEANASMIFFFVVAVASGVLWFGTPLLIGGIVGLIFHCVSLYLTLAKK